MFKRDRIFCLVVGLVVGLCLAYVWPHEPVLAVATDRTEKLLLTTVPLELDNEAVFVLDFLTGRLQGAALSKQGAFVWSYYRNIAEDFQVDPTAKPNYALVAGMAPLPNRGPVQWGNGALYVAELTSGRVQCYGIPYTVAQRPQPPVQLQPVGNFSFRETAQ